MREKIPEDRVTGIALGARRRPLIGSIFVGAALALAFLSLAWACTLHSPGAFQPLQGPPGTPVAVAASTFSVTYNGTQNILIAGPVTHSVSPLVAAPQVCGVQPSQSQDMGDITYTRGVGRGTATIPSSVKGHNVQHGEQYEMCAMPLNTGGPGTTYPAWDMFTIVML